MKTLVFVAVLSTVVLLSACTAGYIISREDADN